MTDERPTPGPGTLTDEESKSVTHGGFRMDSPQREAYEVALRLLYDEGPPTVMSGLYALWHHTGIYRRTKDLDLMFRPHEVVAAARILREKGYRTVLEGGHWLAKAYRGEVWIDLVFGMANGLHLVDDAWVDHAHESSFLGVPVLVASPEDLIFHRLFIQERHRSDMADIAHLFLTHGERLDWDRILARIGDHWRLLHAQVNFFDFVYPRQHGRIPRSVRKELLDRGLDALDDDPPAAGEPVCQGTLLSLYSFAIDVNEWGFRDYRAEAVEASCGLPVVEEIMAADVWDEVKDGEER